MPTVINSGTPLSGSSAAPLWTASCDNSADLNDPTVIPPLVLALPAIQGSGQWVREVQLTSPGVIDNIALTGTMFGKFQDNFSINLKHQTYGTIPLLLNHSIGTDAPLAVPYPDTSPADIDIIIYLNEDSVRIPQGYRFLKYVGNPERTTFTLPQGVQPPTYYGNPAHDSDLSVASITQPPAPYTVSILPHRLPSSPNYGNANETTAGPYTDQGGVLYTPENDNTALIQSGTVVVQFSSATGDYEIISSTFPAIPFSGQFDPVLGTYAPLPYTEAFYAQWVGSETFNLFSTQYIPGIVGGYKLLSTYYFFTNINRTWLVQPPGLVTYTVTIAPQAVFRFYPPDYDEYNGLSQRNEALNAIVRDWYNNPGSGLFTLEVTVQPVVNYTVNSVGGGLNPDPANSSVTPSPVGILNPTLTLTFKQNQPYLQSSLTSSVIGGNTVCQTSGTLFLTPDDRAMLAILCGIGASVSRGIVCGYSVLQTDLTKAIYTISYFIGITCNINNVNYTRFVKSIEYTAQDWSGFSEKGNQGRAYLQAARGNKIYPVDGQLGLQVSINGSTLTFELLGNYPALTYTDPTVALIGNFTRYSLNA